jgi:hypothetical protein
MKKKVFSIVGILIGLLLLTIILVPILFKGKILDYVKEETNKSLNAVVEFDNDIKLNLFKNFPDFSLTINNVNVINKTPFEGDTLASIGGFHATLDLMSVIGGDKINIKKIQLDNPNIYLHVLNDTTGFIANWDIAIPTEEMEIEDESDTVSNFRLELTSLILNNARFVYDDELYLTYIEMDGMNLSGSGDLTMDIYDLDINTEIEKFTFAYDHIPYLNKVNTNLDAVISMNMPEMKFTFKDNLLRLNDFFLEFDGFLAMPTADMEMDLSFNAPETEFKNLISLVPAIYASDFESLKTSGNITFNGKLNGIYGTDVYPAFDINVGIDKGMFQYPDLPLPLQNVMMKLNIQNPKSDLDFTIVDLSQLHFELGQEKFDAKLLVKTPMSDPYLDAMLKGNINLENIGDLVDLGEGNSISGFIRSNLAMKGNYSTIENEQYEDFQADGEIHLQNIVLNTTEFPEEINMPTISLAFSPKSVELKNMRLLIGKNDVSLSGGLQNFIPYVFNKGIIEGNLNLTSNYFNVNDFMPETSEENATEEAETTESSEMAIVEIPKDVHFNFDAKMQEVIYEELTMNNVVCNIEVVDGEVKINQLSTNAMDGSLGINGVYSTKDLANPFMNFNLDIADFGIKDAFEVSGIVQKFIPIAKYIEGDFDGEISLETKLLNNMMPDLETLFSKGVLSIDKANVKDFKALNMAANTLKMDELKNLAVSNIKPSFRIEDGRFILENPIAFKAGKTDFELQKDGYTTLAQNINYVMKVDMPADKAKQGSEMLLKGIGQENLNVPIGETITVYLEFTGKTADPQIRILHNKNKFSLKDQAKDQAQQKIDETKEQAKEELDKAKQEAEEKLRQEAEQKKKEAEEKARQEAEKQKKKAEEEAKKKIKGILK